MFLLSKGQLITGNTKTWIGTDTIKEFSFSDHVHNNYAPINHTHDQYLTEETVTPIIINTVASIPGIKVNLLEEATFNKTTQDYNDGLVYKFTASFDPKLIFGIIIDLNIESITCSFNYTANTPNKIFATILHLVNDPMDIYSNNFTILNPNDGAIDPGNESAIMVLTGDAPSTGANETRKFSNIQRKLLIPYSTITKVGLRQTKDNYSSNNYLKTSDKLTYNNLTSTLLDQLVHNTISSNIVLMNTNGLTISNDSISNLKLLICRRFYESNYSTQFSDPYKINVKGSCKIYTLSL